MCAVSKDGGTFLSGLVEGFAIMEQQTIHPQKTFGVPLATHSAIKQWQADGIAFKGSYELAGALPTGEPCYGCVYELPNETAKYMLVSSPEERLGFIAVVLFGWEEVRNHHRWYGDGRDLTFKGDDTIEAT